MATHALGYAPEDPVCLVESCRRAIEWILITHAAHGRLVARPWIDHPYGEEEITLPWRHQRGGRRPHPQQRRAPAHCFDTPEQAQREAERLLEGW